MQSKFWKIFFRTLNPWLTAICVLCIIFVFMMDMDILTVKEPIKVFVAIGSFNYGVAISYIAAYIFYLITVHYVETRSAISIYTSAEFPADAIVSNVYEIFIEMSQALGKSLRKEDLNQTTVKEILNATGCFSDSTLSKTDLTKYNWLEYLKHTEDTINSFYSQLYPLYPKLDGEYVSAMANLKQVNFSKPIIGVVAASIKYTKAKREDIYFSNGLEDILLELYEKAVMADHIIAKRRAIYEIK